MQDIPDWADIAPSQTDANSPITSNLMKALADRTPALAGGADDAPRNLLKSIERLVAGDTTRSRRTSLVIPTTGTPQEIHAFDFMQIGTIRVVVNSTLGDAQIVRLRNGSTTTLVGSTSSDISADVNVIPFDRVIVRGTTTNSGNTYDVFFRTDGGDLWAGVSARVEGNNV